MKVKVVLDTSVWVAALLSSKGASFEIIRWFLDKKLDLILSYEMYRELEQVLNRPHIKQAIHLDESLLKKIKKFLKAIRKKVKDRTEISRDPKDNMFVSAALSYGAGYVVSLDKDLLVLGTYKNVSFMKPGDFVHLLRKGIL